MKKIKKIVLLFISSLFFSLFSYYPIKNKSDKNKKEIEDLILNLVENNNIFGTISINNAIKFKNDINSENENNLIVNASNLNEKELINIFTLNSTFINNNNSKIIVNDTLITIEDYQTFNYKVDKPSYSNENNNIKNENKVTFTGIDINKETTKWVYSKLLSFTDSYVNKYKGLGGIAFECLKLSAPAFVLKFTYEISKIVYLFTSWLKGLGFFGYLIYIILIIFVASFTTILCMIIWAGSHNQGYRLGLKLRGFKINWVSEFYE